MTIARLDFNGDPAHVTLDVVLQLLWRRFALSDQWRIQGEAEGAAAPIAPCNFGSGDFILTVWGTVSTFVACCYKHDICIGLLLKIH